jgi:3',5'-cyclic AMP phosphodiesterase CpdA
MREIRRLSIQLAICLLLPLLISVDAVAGQYRWTGVDRVVAMSDPHGAYDSMVRTLVSAGVIDESMTWSGGRTHLVITGDLLDRGADSRKIMDLVMRLESESVDSGGMVHLTLGNHEVMNLVGDLRYVSRDEYAAFAEEESADEREAWFRRFRSTQALQNETPIDDAKLRAAFDKERPPGFYGHRQAFASEGKYGRWLLQKPLVVVVNDIAFVHAGLPQMIAGYSLDRLNDELRSQVSDYVRQFEILSDVGLVDPATNFYLRPSALGQLAAEAMSEPKIALAIKNVVSLNDAVVHDSSGPIWYRGTVACSVLSEGDVLANALAALGAARLVIGHTPTVTRRVLQRFDGRVIEIDTGMLKPYYKGFGNALIIEGDSVLVVTEGDNIAAAPLPHPRRVGARAAELSTVALAQLLANADIVSTYVDQAGRTVVELSRDGVKLSALFVASPRKKGLNTELAAYRLDSLLGLDMVPVTVARELIGKSGTLQFLPGNTRDEAYRAAGGQSGDAQCPLPRQWNSMYIFDALIFNESRTPTSMVYNPRTWQLMSMGHAGAFATKRGRPEYLAEIPLELTSTWVDALSALTNEVLAQNLGDVLDKRRIAALGKRRDYLIRLATQPVN